MLTCPSCGAPAADLVRFCAMCGHALANGTPSAPSSITAGVRTLARRSRIVRAGLTGAIVLQALNAIAAASDPLPVPAGTPVDDGTVLSAIFGFLLTVGTAVAWLLWQHRAQRNLHEAGLRDLRFTPGWAVGWWLIPFANLVMPYRTTTELVLRSAPTDAPPEVPAWLAAWWGSWVGSSVLLAVGAILQGSPVEDTYRSGSYAVAAGSAAAVVAGILARRVVRTVQMGQEARA